MGQTPDELQPGAIVKVLGADANMVFSSAKGHVDQIVANSVLTAREGAESRRFCERKMDFAW